MTRKSSVSRLLDRAIALDRADFGNVQAFDPRTKTLRIVAQRGFDEDFLAYFRCVKAFDSSACGRAAGLGGAVVIADVERDPGFARHRKIAEAAGFRSVKSVPIRGRDGELVGVLSTHCRKPRRLWDLGAVVPVLAELAERLEASMAQPSNV